MSEEKRFNPSEQEKFRLALEQAPVAVFIMDKNWNFEYINPEFEKLSGYSRDELLHKNISETLYRNIQGITEAGSEIVESLIEGKSWKGELLTIDHDGSKYWAKTTASPYKNKIGKIEGYIVIQHDVTESIRMQEALQRSEQRFRELTEMLPQAIYELDVNGNPTFMNRAGRKAFGIGEGPQDKKAYEYFAAEDMEKMKETLDREAKNIINENGVLQPFATKPVEYTANRADGTSFPVIIYGTAIVDEGKVTGSRGIIIDISERKAMENALRESEEKYKALIEKATDGIVITQNGLLKFTNQAMCEMMQYSAEEFIDKSFYDYVIPEDHKIMQQFHKRRMKGEIFNSLYRSHFIRKDGIVITVELNTRTSDYNGSPAAFIVIRNISERLNIEKELMQAKNDLELLNKNLEERIKESSDSLTEARTQLIRLQKENLQSQFEVLRQQVNPHFLFNSLNVLTSLIKLKPDLAEKFTEHLSKVYRYVLENKDNDLVNLKTELDFLDAYLFLLNIRFKDKIFVTINIENDKNDFLILPLALQLLIENAIKHNSMSKKAPLRINLFIDWNNFLNIENNLQERESYITSTGVGHKNIEHRYRLLEMEAPEFIKTETSFIARIPLKEPEIQQQKS
jgi:PAS domain S-box-containing protein